MQYNNKIFNCYRKPSCCVAVTKHLIQSREGWTGIYSSSFTKTRLSPCSAFSYSSTYGSKSSRTGLGSNFCILVAVTVKLVFFLDVRRLLKRYSCQKICFIDTRAGLETDRYIHFKLTPTVDGYSII